jgi:uncharacterized 2Fe-2S/4Fe-4S cluster protein (DUF4445 family)
VEKIETALEPKFQEYFIDAMAVPHKTDRFEELSRFVTLPEPKPKADINLGDDRNRRSSRRRRGRS